jgi:hypothetical protein
MTSLLARGWTQEDTQGFRVVQAAVSVKPYSTMCCVELLKLVSPFLLNCF